MALWLVRAGRNGEREQDALQRNLAIIGWSRLGDLSDIKTKSELRSLLESQYPDSSKSRISNFTGQIWRFLRRISEPNDLIALPLKSQPAVAIGRVTGPYSYKTDLGPEIRYTRPVQWLRTDIPRAAFDQDLLYSLGASMTICQITRNNAEERVRAMLSGKQAPPSGKDDAGPGEDEPDTTSLDLERVGYDQIQEIIDRRFKG